MLVLWMMLRGAQMKTMTDVSLLNLVIADLLLIFTLPFQAHYARDTWVFGNVMCTLVLGVFYIGFYAAIFFIVLISIDRYLAIVHSLFVLNIRTKAFGILACMVVWMIAVAASFPELLHFEGKAYDTGVVCTAYQAIMYHSYGRSTALFKMNVFGMMIPLGIVGFCYSMVLRNLKTSTKLAVRLVVVVTCVFFCCWIPYNIAAFLKALELKGTLPQECEISKGIHLMLQVTQAVAYSHSCLNPFLYVFLGENYKQHLARLLLQTPCVRAQCIKNYLTQVEGSVDPHIENVDELSVAI
ncbi:C-C chemokine receptor type 8-like isoform 2-T5 [Clarias gariepinus]|nr:C-C chemokine receptor type 8-like isoform X2 [Clarias gariepinus]XP_053349615.1 C-C chemokine receptor type 8-like isoform X2 [Clarias gariepinus]XP_053349616.1 C-C chemokine receptor type 8-like isoform X2 [Clarias gariepinus]